MSDIKQVVSVILRSGMELIGEFVEANEEVVSVKNPQVYQVLTNQMIPFGIHIESKDRVFDFKLVDTMKVDQSSAPFTHAYKITYPEQFVEENTSELDKIAEADQKARLSEAEKHSPVHGKTKSDSGIILQA